MTLLWISEYDILRCLRIVRFLGLLCFLNAIWIALNFTYLFNRGINLNLAVHVQHQYWRNLARYRWNALYCTEVNPGVSPLNRLLNFLIRCLFPILLLFKRVLSSCCTMCIEPIVFVGLKFWFLIVSVWHYWCYIDLSGIILTELEINVYVHLFILKNMNLYKCYLDDKCVLPILMLYAFVQYLFDEYITDVYG